MNNLYQNYMNLINEEFNGRLIKNISFLDFKNKIIKETDLIKRFGNKETVDEMFNELKKALNEENPVKEFNRILRKYSLISKIEINNIENRKIDYILK